ncbi:hypothetical protein MLD38_021494 [Melastoma candidum]|uniref:Uncharacterized protein n=1 Tax=Melastoma candidum TaxID=119954 RepID=A0ACB9QGC9_9MYRT|nr:hypothetical protein MLD38_021494 [Melastoma candidum]
MRPVGIVNPFAERTSLRAARDLGLNVPERHSCQCHHFIFRHQCLHPEKSLAEGRQVHVYVKFNGLEDNEFLKAKLVNMYMSCGSPEDGRRIFDTGSSTTTYLYNALMRGAVIAGGQQYRGVMSTFSEMQELGIDCTEYTYSCLISSILKTCLVDMYFKCGKVKLGCHVFEETEDGTSFSGEQ